MKIPSLPRPAAVRLAVAALALALCAGCASTKQVKSIVAESNAAMLATQIADVDLAGDPLAVSSKPDWQVASRKIDEFIAAHPDQSVAASALRVRQAMLLIAHGQFELARSAFSDATNLKTDRDKALKALSEPIIWWWEHSQTATLNDTQLAKSREHLDAFDRELAKINASPDIHDLLAEMRARIGLKRVAAIQLTDGTRKKDAFVDVLNHYGAIFTTNDIAALKSGSFTPLSPAISTVEKRRLRALAVIEKAKTPAQVLRNGHQAVALSDLKPDAAVRGFGEIVLGP
jgi:hypothetical protein